MAKNTGDTGRPAEVPAAADRGEELVEYTAPLLPIGEKQEIFAGVNGETVRIRRGAPVKIKRKFLEVLQNAQEQELAAYYAKLKAQEDGGKPHFQM